MSIFDRIGTLADRLRERLGREFGVCRTCGNPTRSHRVGDGVQCHTCYADGEHVVATDGGLDRNVTPARQCTHGRCEDEAVDTDHDGQLCEQHLAELDGDQDEDRDHDNPINVSDVTDAERAAMLREYIEVFVDEFDAIPRLMPLDDEGKTPIIQGRCPLDSPEGRSFLVDGEEAIRQIREEGARGFAIYAGKPDHRTADLLLVDDDDPEHFPREAFPPTLQVLSGSGRGTHDTYRNAGDVENAKGKDGVDGEIRAENWYCVVPGSIHPSGGVYHVTENRDVATLANDDIPPELQPGSSRSDRERTAPDVEDLDGRGETPDESDTQERLEAAFNNPHDGDRIEQVYNGRYRAAGFDDRSSAEFWLANRLDSFVGLGDERRVERLMDRANLQKWPDRPDRSYRASILANVGYQDWYYTDDEDNPAIDPVAVLPNAPVERAKRNVWDWRGEDDHLEIDDVRQRTVDTIADALKGGERLVDVLPTGGKSYGAIAAAARPDSPPITIFTTRGRKEQYGQLADWCDDHGLTHKTLPSFFETCPTARGDHGEEWAERVRNWYRRGATGQDIHKYAEDVLGRPLPCQCDDHGEPIECPYTSAWRFDPDKYDVLIGHYVHAYNPKVVAGRGAIFDEFTGGAYERVLGTRLKGAVSYYLKTRPDVPFDDYTDLIENRQDPQRRADGIVALEDDLEPDGRSVLEDDGAHAAAPLATFTLLAAAENDLGNGLERAAFPDDSNRVGIHHRETESDRKDGGVRVLTPPDLESASAVVALDGTPTPELWNLTLGTDLYHDPVLDDDDERAEYLQDALGLSIVPTTTWQKPYNSEDHVNTADDAALLEAITDKHGETPGVISTKTALDTYADEDVIDYDEETGEVLDGPAERVRWYGNVLGSNEFKTKRVGAVIGSNHYGDGYIKKWGAYAGEVVERGGGKGAELTYGDFGDRVLTHMREHDTLQAALRFGRDGNGATVYVHTDTLPDWVPTAGHGEVIRPKSDGERQVLDAVAGLNRDYWTTRDITDAVTIGERRVRQILDALVERGHVQKGQAADDGRAVEWRDGGLEELPDHVALPDIEADDESSGNARSRTIYTHISGTSPGHHPSDAPDPAGEGVATDGGVSIGGDPPPR